MTPRAATTTAVLMLAACAALSVLITESARALGAPFLGPWAGLTVGHQDCTMGHMFPAASMLLVSVGALMLVGLAAARREWRGWLRGSLLAWLAVWCVTCLLSMANTRS